MIGFYGVMSYNVTRGRNELGMRTAGGAKPGRLLRMVMGEVAIGSDRRRFGDRTKRARSEHRA